MLLRGNRGRVPPKCPTACSSNLSASDGLARNTGVGAHRSVLARHALGADNGFGKAHDFRGRQRAVLRGKVRRQRQLVLGGEVDRARGRGAGRGVRGDGYDMRYVRVRVRLCARSYFVLSGRIDHSVLRAGTGATT